MFSLLQKTADKLRALGQDLAERYPSLQAVPYFVAAILTGFIAVGFSTVFHWLSDWVQAQAQSREVWMLLLSPLAMSAAWLLVRFVAREAAGSGIPQVMAAMELEPQENAERLHRLLGFRTLAVKIVSSLLCILGAGAVGPEGPIIQIAGGLFNSVGNRFRAFWPKLSHHSLVIAGAAAGVAAAFNTPLGGIVFALEELSHLHFIRFKTVLIAAVIVAGVVAQWLVGPYLLFGYPVVHAANWQSTFAVFPLAALCGFLGGVFGRLIRILNLKVRVFPVSQRLLLIAWVSVTMTLGAWYIGPEVLGGGTNLIEDLLFRNDATVEWPMVFGRFAGPILSYLCGSAAGMLAPALSAGAALSGWVVGLIHLEQKTLLVLVGMIAFLSGLTRAPFTAFVLVLEMTDRHAAIFPMMMGSLVASAAARLAGTESFYALLKHEYMTDALPGRGGDAKDGQTGGVSTPPKPPSL